MAPWQGQFEKQTIIQHIVLGVVFEDYLSGRWETHQAKLTTANNDIPCPRRASVQAVCQKIR
jgi:hypothetical protein